MCTQRGNLVEAPCNLAGLRRVRGNLGGPHTLIPNTAPGSPFSSHLLSHRRAPVSAGPHIAHASTNPPSPAVFLRYLFIAAKIPRAAGEKLLKTPQAPGLTSKQLSSFFTRGFQDPRLFSLSGTRFSWRFSSVISLFTELGPWTSCFYLICTCPHGP